MQVVPYLDFDGRGEEAFEYFGHGGSRRRERRLE
jgi:hypothetical protein